MVLIWQVLIQHNKACLGDMKAIANTKYDFQNIFILQADVTLHIREIYTWFQITLTILIQYFFWK